MLETVLLGFSKAGGKAVVTGSQQEPLVLLGTFTCVISFNPKNNPTSERKLNIH